MQGKLVGKTLLTARLYEPKDRKYGIILRLQMGGMKIVELVMSKIFNLIVSRLKWVVTAISV